MSIKPTLDSLMVHFSQLMLLGTDILWGHCWGFADGADILHQQPLLQAICMVLMPTIKKYNLLMILILLSAYNAGIIFLIHTCSLFQIETS